MTEYSRTEFDYVGSELDVFSDVTNWKKYWADLIAPYIGDEVLDVGAGIGATAINLSTKKYTRWVELEPDAKLAQRILQRQLDGVIQSEVEVKVGTSQDLSLVDQFDTILYIDVLEHIDDDSSELNNIAKHLKRGGHIITLSPAHQFLYTEFDKQIGHYRRYNKHQLRNIAPPGMEIVYLRYIDSVGIIASLANKLLLKSDSPTHAQVRVWDRVMVPLSKCFDPATAYLLGKSIICIYKKKN